MVKPLGVNSGRAKMPSEMGNEVKRTQHIEEVNSTWQDTAIDSIIDKRLKRKFDKHIMPWLFGLFLFAFIDRSNIGNARIHWLATDLQLDANNFNIALAVFYVLYICVDVCYQLRSYFRNLLTGIDSKQSCTQTLQSRQLPSLSGYNVGYRLSQHGIYKELHRSSDCQVLPWSIGRRIIRRNNRLYHNVLSEA
jgi:hypothetical protein